MVLSVDLRDLLVDTAQGDDIVNESLIFPYGNAFFQTTSKKATFTSMFGVGVAFILSTPLVLVLRKLLLLTYNHSYNQQFPSVSALFSCRGHIGGYSECIVDRSNQTDPNWTDPDCVHTATSCHIGTGATSLLDLSRENFSNALTASASAEHPPSSSW